MNCNKCLAKSWEILSIMQICISNRVIPKSWALEDGIIKGGSYNIDRGVGVRAISGEKTGFAYSDDILMLASNKRLKLRVVLASMAVNSLSKRYSGQQGISYTFLTTR